MYQFLSAKWSSRRGSLQSRVSSRRKSTAQAEDAIKVIRRATRRHFSAEDKIRIAGGSAWGGQHLRAVSPRRHRFVDVLWLVEGVPGGRQEAPCRGTARAATSDEVKDLRRETQALKEVVADLTLENRLLKKSMIGDWGRRGVRVSPSDKTEIIRLVEQSHLPARRTLEKLGIPRSSFYRWYDRHQRGGPEALADRPSRPDRSGTPSQKSSAARSST